MEPRGAEGMDGAHEVLRARGGWWQEQEAQRRGQSAVPCLAEAARRAHQLVLRRGLLDQQQA